MSQLVTAARSFVREEEGATMVEYGLMLALVVVVCATAAALVGTRANTKFGSAATTLS